MTQWTSTPKIDYNGMVGVINRDDWFNDIIDICSNMEANDVCYVYDFGINGDLKLNIYKDEDYKANTDEYNMVVINTSQLNSEEYLEPVDDTEDIHISELWKELERIWNYEDYGLL